MALRYSVESEPLGTGGAIRLAWQEGGSPEVFVLNGDTYLETDYGAMLAEHREAGSQLSIAVHHVADTARYGALEIADDRIVGFREKGAAGPGWINAGTYLLDSALRTRLPSHGHFSFEQDVLVPEVGSIRPLDGSPCRWAWRSIFRAHSETSTRPAPPVPAPTVRSARRQSCSRQSQFPLRPPG